MASGDMLPTKSASAVRASQPEEPPPTPRGSVERLFPALTSLFAILMGIGVLIGWQFRISFLKTPFPTTGSTYMTANAALCFMLSGLSLWLQRDRVREARSIWVGKACATFVLVFGGLTLLEYLTAFNFGIDRLFFAHRLSDWTLASPPGRFAPTTALAFLLLALALLSLGRKSKRQSLSEVFSVSVALIAFLGVMGYWYGVPYLSGFGTAAKMGLHTAITFLVLSAGVMFARTDHGSSALLLSRDLDGVMARRLLLTLAIVVPVLGWLSVLAENRRIIEHEFGTALLVAIWLLVFSLLIVNTARLLRRENLHRRTAEQALRQAKQERERHAAQLQTVLDNTQEGLVASDLDGTIFHWNPAALEMHGFASMEECRRRLPELAQIFELSALDGTVWPLEQWPLARILRGETLRELEARIRRRNSDWRRIFSYGGTLVRDMYGHPLMAVVTVMDITERRQREEQLQELNRTLRALNNSNQALLHATDEAVLLEEVCKIVTQDCGHAMVWVGYAEDDEHKTVRPVAHAGFEEGYLQTLQVTWADTERGRGPTGTAIRTGQPCLCRNMLTDPQFAPWREQAIKRGYASSIALPLMDGGKAFGAITIYSREPDSFSPEEVKLLAELAADVAYGISALRLRVAHQQVEEQLESVALFPAENPNPVLRVLANGQLIYANQAAEALFAAEGWDCNQPVPAPLREAAAAALAGEHANEFDLSCRDGGVVSFACVSVPSHGYVNFYGRDVTQARRAQEALRESEERLRISAMAAEIGVWSWKPGTGDVAVSANWRRLFGVAPDAIVTFETWRNALHPEDRERALEALFAASEQHREFSSEYRILRPDGTERWIVDRGSASYGENGQAVGMAGINLDITERKRAEEKLVEVHQRLQALMQALPVGVSFSDDATCQRVTGNPAVLAQFDVGREDNLSASAPDHSAPGRQVQFLQAGRRISSAELPLQQAVTENREIAPIELEVRLPSGRCWFTEASGAPVRDARGNVIAGVAVTVDISARKRAEAELERAREQAERSAAQLRTIVDSMSEQVYVCDAEGNPILVNKEFRRFHTGRNAAVENIRKFEETAELFDLSGQRIALEDWPVFRVLRGERLHALDVRMRRDDLGKDFIMRYHGAPVLDPDGNIIMAVLTSEDITAATQAEEALVRSEKLATVGRMAATIAHEINNPLAAVVNTLYIVKHDAELPDSARHYVEIADAELQRICHLTRQALGFYRESSAPATTSVTVLLDSAVDLFQSRIRSKRVAVEKQYEAAPEVTAVAGELRQVFSNLLANSLDAVDENGTIALRVSNLKSLRSGSACVRVTVADNGKGIPAAALPRIFEPFFTTKHTVGTGLGLWVTKQIVEKHGGSIRVRSRAQQPGRGTVISLTFPAVPAAHSEPRASSQAHSA